MASTSVWLSGDWPGQVVVSGALVVNTSGGDECGLLTGGVATYSYSYSSKAEEASWNDSLVYVTADGCLQSLDNEDVSSIVVRKDHSTLLQERGWANVADWFVGKLPRSIRNWIRDIRCPAMICKPTETPRPTPSPSPAPTGTPAACTFMVDFTVDTDDADPRLAGIASTVIRRTRLGCAVAKGLAISAVPWRVSPQQKMEQSASSLRLERLL